MRFAPRIPLCLGLMLLALGAQAGESAPAATPPKPAATPPAPAADKTAAKVAKELVPMPELTDASNHLKNLPIGPTKVSFTVENQTRLEVWDNKFLPNRRQYSNGVTYFRTRLSMDWDLHEHLRLFVQGQDARKDGDLRNQGRANENPTDLNELFLDVRKLFNEDLTIRIGRQPLVYGAQRLVGSFEWSNVGRRFDAVRVFWNSKDKNWSADAFASKVVVTDPEEVDEGHPTEEFYGLYLVNRTLKKHCFDFYAFYRTNDNGRTTDELNRRGDLDIGTIGGRAYGNNLLGGLDYEVEGAAQFGKVAKADNQAGAVHAEAGWTFKPSWKPRVMAEFNYGSGDENPRDGKSGAFNNLFPTNHLHYGYADYINWSNTISAALGFTAQPARGVKVWAKGYWFWLAEDRDAWRNAGGAVLGRDLTGRSGNDVGSEFDVGINADLNKHLGLQAGYSLFCGGDFMEATRRTNDELSQFLYFQFKFKF